MHRNEVFKRHGSSAPEHLTEEGLVELMEQNRKDVNPLLPAYAQLAGIKIMNQEFEKTPKKSIKRFLYANEEI